MRLLIARHFELLKDRHRFVLLLFVILCCHACGGIPVCMQCMELVFVSTAGRAEETLLLRWPELALQVGDEEGALEGAAAACQAVPTSSAAWQQRLALQARHATLQVSIMSASCSYRVAVYTGCIASLSDKRLLWAPDLHGLCCWGLSLRALSNPVACAPACGALSCDQLLYMKGAACASQHHCHLKTRDAASCCILCNMKLRTKWERGGKECTSCCQFGRAVRLVHVLPQACETSDDGDDAAMGKAARQVERLAVQAVAACEPEEAQPVWLLAFEKLTALGSSSKKLTQALLRRLTGMRQGPTRVRPFPPATSLCCQTFAQTVASMCSVLNRTLARQRHSSLVSQSIDQVWSVPQGCFSHAGWVSKQHVQLCWLTGKLAATWCLCGGSVGTFLALNSKLLSDVGIWQKDKA